MFKLATLLFFITSCVWFKTAQDYKSQGIDLTNDKNTSDSLYIWQSERLLNYTLISLEQSKIIDKFQSSRNEKNNNKYLLELTTKLD